MQRLQWPLILCAGAILVAWPAMSAPLSFEALDRQLEATDGTWRAAPRDGASPLRGGAALPEIEASIPEQLHAAETAERLTQSDVLPARFDWRDQQGASYLADVGAQGECGSCVSFAAVSTLEAQLNIACGTPQRSFTLSRQYFFSCGGGSCAGGWKLSDAVAFLVDKGVPDEACMPYAAGDGNDISCQNACDDAPSRVVHGVTTTRPTSGYVDVAAIKRGILHGPLLANMILFEDLEFYAGGVYRHTSGRQLGSHAIVLVGWDDADKAWIARNSWGERWGEQGYFRIAWDDSTLPGRYTWSFDVDAAKAAGACSRPR